MFLPIFCAFGSKVLRVKKEGVGTSIRFQLLARLIASTVTSLFHTWYQMSENVRPSPVRKLVRVRFPGFRAVAFIEFELRSTLFSLPLRGRLENRFVRGVPEIASLQHPFLRTAMNNTPALLSVVIDPW